MEGKAKYGRERITAVVRSFLPAYPDVLLIARRIRNFLGAAFLSHLISFPVVMCRQ